MTEYENENDHFDHDHFDHMNCKFVFSFCIGSFLLNNQKRILRVIQMWRIISIFAL